MSYVLTRRQFLLSTGAGITSALIFPQIGHTFQLPCKTWTTNHETVFENYDIALAEPWASILDVARRTPSPHNTQPWKLRVYDQRRAELFLDHTRALPAEDLTGCFIICALGMFAEACRIVAANAGITLTFKKNLVIQEGVQYSSLGWFEISTSKATASEFSNELFVNRRTSRLHLSPDLVSPNLLAKLNTRVSSAQHRIACVTDRKLIGKILDLNIKAVVSDMQTESYHDEIIKWFRYDENEAMRRKDGLSAECMTLSRREFRFFANNPDLATFPLLGPIIRSQYRSSLGDASQIAILCGEFFTPNAAFDVGRMFLHLWLEMSKNELYLHPFGNLITNIAARKRLVELTGVVDPWIVFRFGYSPIPPESYRLDTSNLVI